MKTFELAPDSIQSLVVSTMTSYHSQLANADVQVRAIFAETDDDSPAIKKSGFPVLAQISVVREKDRTTKNHDAEILIDRAAWTRLTDKQRLATIDHELNHLKIRTKDGNLLRDCFGRPRLRLIKGDWNVGDGFEDVVRRHREASVELENIRRAHQIVQEIIAESADDMREGDVRPSHIIIAGGGDGAISA